MTTFPTVLFKVQDEIKKTLAAITHPDSGPNKLFGFPSNVFFQGERRDTTDLGLAPTAVAEVVFVDPFSERDMERGEETITGKLSHFVPVAVDVFFSSDTIAGADLREWHTKLFGLVLDAFMNNRKLNASAIDITYLGGGSAVHPEDEEEAPDRWRFQVRFEVHYRHLDTDSGVQV